MHFEYFAKITYCCVLCILCMKLCLTKFRMNNKVFCIVHLLWYDQYVAFTDSVLLSLLTPVFNPILTGGGVNLTPPCTKSVTASRPPQIATRLFVTFFFQVLRIFWYQVCENRTIGREGHVTFCTRTSAQNLPKIRILLMFVYKTHGNYWIS